MARGRKAEAGTHEARMKIDLICTAISSCELSQDASNRAIKAVKFGLGIKENVTIEKENNVIEQKVGLPYIEKDESLRYEDVVVSQQENEEITAEVNVDDNVNHHKEHCKCEYCQDKENDTPIKEKKQKKTKTLQYVEGDEYFKPEDCYEAN